LKKFLVDDSFVAKIPISYARQHQIIGLVDAEGDRICAISDLENWQYADITCRILGYAMNVLLAPASVIQERIGEAYESRIGESERLVSLIDEEGHTRSLSVETEDLLDSTGRAPTIRLVNEVLFEAIKTRASDVHFQPRDGSLVVRLRIDGVLFDHLIVPMNIQDEVISRLKVTGKMNIAEKRLPQDGRASVQIGDRKVDLRFSAMPTSHGECIVIRLLDKGSRLMQLQELGMGTELEQQFSKLISVEHGMILVTGPTGSGKSTTLYAGLQEIDAEKFNAVTLEDPIEYQLSGISQTQINEKKGMTFASGLRSILRQDPDIIMLGEIRDRETAVMAVQSALTGHLVFSTLHTNDSASAIARLLDLGIEPFLVSSSLVGILAQRLVRKVCTSCGQPIVLNETEHRELSLNEIQLQNLQPRVGSGCSHCRESGYSGRIGVYELLMINDAIRDKIHERASSSEIREVALASKMQLLRNACIQKVVDGETTMEELYRISMRTEM
jgi:general secretion pathway protein E